MRISLVALGAMNKTIEKTENNTSTMRGLICERYLDSVAPVPHLYSGTYSH